MTTQTTRIIAVFGTDLTTARELALDIGAAVRSIRSLPLEMLRDAGLDVDGRDRRGVSYSFALIS